MCKIRQPLAIRNLHKEKDLGTLFFCCYAFSRLPEGNLSQTAANLFENRMVSSAAISAVNSPRPH